MRDNWDDIFYPENVIEAINQNTDEKMVDHIRKANHDYVAAREFIDGGISA